MFIRIGMATLVTLGIINVPSYSKSGEFQGNERGMALHFKLREDYKVIVPVSVNGLEPAGFILDTGTKTSIVDERICRKLDLQTIARMPLTTFTGTSMVTIAQLDKVTMANALARRLEVACVDLKKVYSLDSEIYGVLGQNFLVQFNYLLNYRGRKIVLEEDGNLRKDLDGVELPVEVIGDRDYVVYDSGLPAQPQVRFMLDSGSRFTVIFENPQINSALRVERDIPTMYSPGSVGGRRIDSARIRTLTVGGETVNNLTVRLTRARETERRWENGLLPTVLFRAIYFNHEKGYVILNPRISSPY
jgi:hypothetical protein